MWRSSCVGSCGVRARLLIADAGVSISGHGHSASRRTRYGQKYGRATDAQRSSHGHETGEIGTD